jgi:hypothetical protein
MANEKEMSRYIVNPENNFKIIWDIITMMFVFYSCILMPLEFAFEVELVNDV